MTARECRPPAADMALRRDQARARAWKTRREKYGPRGYDGSYARGAASDRAYALIARLWRDGVLSEGQIAKALGIGRAEVRRMCDRYALQEAKG